MTAGGEIMSTTMTVNITDDVRKTIENAAREEGISESEFAARALKDYVFLRQFRNLRERIASESDRTYTDEEVFELVS
jgi:predicted transcriptional regulator